jgi:hypothetical protein
MTLRIICVEVDAGAAANVGGPVHIRRHTFDVPCTEALTNYLNAVNQWVDRSIEGVEVITAEVAK